MVPLDSKFDDTNRNVIPKFVYTTTGWPPGTDTYQARKILSDRGLPSIVFSPKHIGAILSFLIRTESARKASKLCADAPHPLNAPEADRVALIVFLFRGGICWRMSLTSLRK